MDEISRLAKDQLASQEGLYSMEFVVVVVVPIYSANTQHTSTTLKCHTDRVTIKFVKLGVVSTHY